MGQNSSLSLKGVDNKAVILHNWVQHEADRNVLFNLTTHQQVQRTLVRIHASEMQKQIEAFTLRMHEHHTFICRVIYFHPTQQEPRNDSKQMFVYTDRMLPIRDSMWSKEKIVMIFKGLKRIATQQGCFRVGERMLCENQRRQIKVWSNENPAANSRSKEATEEHMLADLASILVKKNQQIATLLLGCRSLSDAMERISKYHYKEFDQLYQNYSHRAENELISKEQRGEVSNGYRNVFHAENGSERLSQFKNNCQPIYRMAKNIKTQANHENAEGRHGTHQGEIVENKLNKNFNKNESKQFCETSGATFGRKVQPTSVQGKSNNRSSTPKLSPNEPILQFRKHQPNYNILPNTSLRTEPNLPKAPNCASNITYLEVPQKNRGNQISQSSQSSNNSSIHFTHSIPNYSHAVHPPAQIQGKINIQIKYPAHTMTPNSKVQPTQDISNDRYLSVRSGVKQKIVYSSQSQTQHIAFDSSNFKSSNNQKNEKSGIQFQKVGSKFINNYITNPISTQLPLDLGHLNQKITIINNNVNNYISNFAPPSYSKDNLHSQANQSQKETSYNTFDPSFEQNKKKDDIIQNQIVVPLKVGSTYRDQLSNSKDKSTKGNNVPNFIQQRKKQPSSYSQENNFEPKFQTQGHPPLPQSSKSANKSKNNLLRKDTIHSNPSNNHPPVSQQTPKQEPAYEITASESGLRSNKRQFTFSRQVEHQIAPRGQIQKQSQGVLSCYDHNSGASNSASSSNFPFQRTNLSTMSGYNQFKVPRTKTTQFGGQNPKKDLGVPRRQIYPTNYVSYNRSFNQTQQKSKQQPLLVKKQVSDQQTKFSPPSSTSNHNNYSQKTSTSPYNKAEIDKLQFYRSPDREINRKQLVTNGIKDHAESSPIVEDIGEYIGTSKSIEIEPGHFEEMEDSKIQNNQKSKIQLKKQLKMQFNMLLDEQPKAVEQERQMKPNPSSNLEVRPHLNQNRMENVSNTSNISNKGSDNISSSEDVARVQTHKNGTNSVIFGGEKNKNQSIKQKIQQKKQAFAELKRLAIDILS